MTALCKYGNENYSESQHCVNRNHLAPWGSIDFGPQYLWEKMRIEHENQGYNKHKFLNTIFCSNQRNYRQ